MRNKLFSPNERWCFPESPSSAGVADRDKCFPERPPRLPGQDPDDRGCFPESPPRGRRRPFDRPIDLILPR